MVQLKKQLFALPTQSVRELLVIPDVAMAPGLPPHVRGVINLRGEVLPLVDLRILLGFASLPSELDAFCTLMRQREEDHRKWLAELEASVSESRAFTLATDPRQCAFGRWYYSYRAENAWVAALLRKFEKPHDSIHALAGQVRGAAAAGQQEAALKRIGQAREREFAGMLGLFAELRALVRDSGRETVVVVACQARSFAVTVDAAVSVERLLPGSIEELPAGARSKMDGLVRRSGRRAKGEELILLIDPDRILHSTDARGRCDARQPFAQHQAEELFPTGDRKALAVG